MTVKERIMQYLEYKNISITRAESDLGWSKSSLLKSNNLSTDKASEFVHFYSDLNTAWLLTGEGSMLKDGNKEIEETTGKYDGNYKLVPLVHIDSVGGIHSANSIENEPQYVEGYIPFMNAIEGDKAIMQSGTSMIPTIPPGSIMQIRKVENWREYFGYGNIFVIELNDGRRITKEVRRYDENPKNFILCVSHNPDIEAEELPKSMIVSVWKVLKVLIDKGW